MSKITSDDAVAMVGGNRFQLILIASQRARELSKGATARISTTSKPVSAALEEVAAGVYTREEYLETLYKRQ